MTDQPDERKPIATTAALNQRFRDLSLNKVILSTAPTQDAAARVNDQLRGIAGYPAQDQEEREDPHVGKLDRG